MQTTICASNENQEIPLFGFLSFLVFSGGLSLLDSTLLLLLGCCCAFALYGGEPAAVGVVVRVVVVVVVDVADALVVFPRLSDTVTIPGKKFRNLKSWKFFYRETAAGFFRETEAGRSLKSLLSRMRSLLEGVMLKQHIFALLITDHFSFSRGVLEFEPRVLLPRHNSGLRTCAGKNKVPKEDEEQEEQDSSWI